MAEPKGPPCGFLGLGFSSDASGNNGCGQDFDIALRRNVGRHEVVDAASDVPKPDKDGSIIGTKSAEKNLKRPHSSHDKQPARRGWSAETWSQIKLDIPTPEPFAYLFAKTAKKTVVRSSPGSENLTPFTRSELLEILDMFPKAPPSAYGIKSASESKLDLAAGRFKNEKDPARRTKGGSSMVIDENYLYSFVPPKKLGGPYKKERAETLAELEKLLVRIAYANLEGTQLGDLKKKLFEEAAAQKLRYEQTIRSVDGFNELTYIIKAHYDKMYDKVSRAQNHERNELYYHPADRLVKEGYEEIVSRQLTTFTEVNVNSWSKNDLDDPTIVYSNKGVRILSDDDPDLPFDERKELEFPSAASRVYLPEFNGEEEARLALVKQDTILENSNEDWKVYVESQILALGEEYLTGGEITIAFNVRASKILFKLKEDLEEATRAFFETEGAQKIKKKEFYHVLDTIETHLKSERNTPGSPYFRLLSFKRDLALRKLRLEIIDKISADQWYFVLQKIPPLELKPHMTHCTHPYCDYHEADLMPAKGYRLIFMSEEHKGKPEYRFDEVSEGAGAPGRTEDGQMLFCLACVENFFNGVGLIKAHKSPADPKEPPQLHPPNIKPAFMAPGLDIFAATLHSFIKPEIRYTQHEFYTLNSFEYQAFMKWKNMCIRKTMWEIPRNRAFNLQIYGKAAAYDLVDFFGDDILDMSEPRPSIVVGIALNINGVNVDDISTLRCRDPSRAGAVEQVVGVKRKTDPLFHVRNVDDVDKSELEHPPGESIAEKLDGKRTRFVKPLSRIMALVDERVQKAWADMVPPYVPRKSRRAPDPLNRKWPPPYFWKSDFKEAWEEGEKMDLQKVIDYKYETINRTLKALGSEDLINYRPQSPTSSYEMDTRGMSAGSFTDNANPEREKGLKGQYVCVICGTTKSPEWRNGPAGHNTLCNACGIRYVRKRQRRLVPPPS